MPFGTPTAAKRTPAQVADRIFTKSPATPAPPSAIAAGSARINPTGWDAPKWAPPTLTGGQFASQSDLNNFLSILGQTDQNHKPITSPFTDLPDSIKAEGANARGASAAFNYNAMLPAQYRANREAAVTWGRDQGLIAGRGNTWSDFAEGFMYVAPKVALAVAGASYADAALAAGASGTAAGGSLTAEEVASITGSTAAPAADFGASGAGGVLGATAETSSLTAAEVASITGGAEAIDFGISGGGGVLGAAPTAGIGGGAGGAGAASRSSLAGDSKAVAASPSTMDITKQLGTLLLGALVAGTADQTEGGIGDVPVKPDLEPADLNPGVEAAATRQKRKNSSDFGRFDTILTGPMGLKDDLLNGMLPIRSGRKTLLGE